MRAALLLDSLAGQGDEAIAPRHCISRSTVVLCIRKCLQFGLDAALGELPRPGKPRQLPDDAIAWVLNCACQKPKELGYSCELWTYKLPTAHVRGHCLAEGHPAWQKLSRSKLHKILRQGELRPRKIRYGVERRDPVRCSGSGTKLSISSPANRRRARRLASRKSFLRPLGARLDCACAICSFSKCGSRSNHTGFQYTGPWIP